jgi:hypothetical protein
VVAAALPARHPRRPSRLRLSNPSLRLPFRRLVRKPEFFRWLIPTRFVRPRLVLLRARSTNESFTRTNQSSGRIG